MRAIDRRMGVPLCFLLSCINGLRQIFRHRTRGGVPPEKVLYIELSEMGSIVLAHSLLKKVEHDYPQAKPYFLTFAENRYAIDTLKIIPEDNVLVIRKDNFFQFAISSVQTIFRLRRMKIDISFDMELYSRFTAIFGYLIGARSRVGYHRYNNEGHYRGNLLTHRVPLNPHLHMAYNLLNLAEAVQTPKEEIPRPKTTWKSETISLPRIEIQAEVRQSIQNRLKGFNPDIKYAQKIILVNPNASEMVPLRRWPLENYTELSRRLMENDGVFILLTGIQSERAEAEMICSVLDSDRCLNLAGQTTFEELLALYDTANILITNDSGPAHFSGLVDIMTFVFFGPETPRLYGPLGKDHHVFYSDFSCSPCVSAFNSRKSPCNNNRCLQAISVDEAYGQIKKYL
ncbi:glycosyltransferase family 9 protein [Acidobacteriota bacterium]